MAQYDVTVRLAHPQLVLEVAGELDMAVAAPLLDTMLSAVLDDTGAGVVVDLAEVSFMDSSGLAVLVELHRRVTDLGRCFSLRNAQPIVHRLIELSGVAEHLDVQHAKTLA
jgi:anti-anti-sigma factor